MTKPVSRLEWLADPFNPLVIRARWIGSGWHYRLHWGDGTSERVLATQPFVRHVYPTAGTYTLIAASEINKVQVDVRVTVRPEKTPQFGSDPLGNGRVRLTIKGGWPGDILHRIQWGDGSPPEEYTATNLAPEHTYPAGTTEAQVTVEDRPARRIAIQTVHITPQPPPTEVRLAWHPTRFWRDSVNMVAGSIRGAAPPGTRVSVRMYSSDPDIHATADAAGHLQFPDVEWVAGSHLFYSPFRSAKAWLPDHPDVPVMWVPLYTRPDEQQDVIPVYLWDLADPMLITLGVISPQAGTYTVDWGDGSPVERVLCDGWVLHAEHRYANSLRKAITVTDPLGRTGVRYIAGPTFNTPWVSKTDQWDTRMATTIAVNDGDWYTPIHIDWGRDEPLWPPAIYHPTSPDDPPKQNTLYEWYKAERGRSVTITMHGPLKAPVRHTMRIPFDGELPIKKAPKGVIDRGANPDPPAFPLDPAWRLDSSGPGGYSGEFTVTNPTAEQAPSWWVSFWLPAPAVIADVWPNSVRLRPLGNGHYAITSTTTLAPDQSITVGIRVEHAGDPALQPTEIRATATKIERNPMSESKKTPVLVAGGYVNADRLVKLYLINPFDFMRDAQFQSAAFADDDWHKATFVDTPNGREARFEVRIGAEIEPGEYQVNATFTHGLKGDFRLIVEPVSDGKVPVTVTRVDNRGMARVKVDGGLSRNVARHLSPQTTIISAQTEMAVDGKKFFGLVFDWATGSAAQNFVLATGAKPGAVYEVAVKQVFHGGHEEILGGSALVPDDPSKPVKGGQSLVYHHLVDTTKLGTKETVEHHIDFGDEHEQPNARYGVGLELVVTGPNGQKPDLNADVRAALRELRPLTVARAIDGITLYGGNPPVLRQNTNFRIKLVVTITPTPTPAGYSDDDPAAPDHVA